MEEKPINHIGIILDGNRRFAKRLMKEPWKGHEWGARKVEKLFDWCKELNIREITLYAFSVENFNRPKIEFDYLMERARQICLSPARKKTETRCHVYIIGGRNDEGSGYLSVS